MKKSGTLWIVFRWVGSLLISILPFVFIDLSFFWTSILIAINCMLPYVSPVFWIWGLVKAINGTQDVWAIVYYIAFAVVFVPYFVILIKSLVKKGDE